MGMTLGMTGDSVPRLTLWIDGCLCLQKINFISLFFLEILQTYFGYFGDGWLWYQMVSACGKLGFCLHAKKKINPRLLLEISLRYFKLLILGILSMPGYPHQKQY